MADGFTVDPMIHHHLSVASALALEINTGMRFSRGSTMLVAADKCSSTKRTKRGVLRDYTKWLAEWFAENHPDKPSYEPNPSVAKALEK